MRQWKEQGTRILRGRFSLHVAQHNELIRVIHRALCWVHKFVLRRLLQVLSLQGNAAGQK